MCTAEYHDTDAVLVVDWLKKLRFERFHSSNFESSQQQGIPRYRRNPHNLVLVHWPEFLSDQVQVWLSMIERIIDCHRYMWENHPHLNKHILSFHARYDHPLYRALLVQVKTPPTEPSLYPSTMVWHVAWVTIRTCSIQYQLRDDSRRFHQSTWKDRWRWVWHSERSQIFHGCLSWRATQDHSQRAASLGRQCPRRWIRRMSQKASSSKTTSSKRKGWLRR